MIGRLPTSLVIKGNKWKIRTDYRDVLNIFCAFNDSELTKKEKLIVCLTILYIDFPKMENDMYEEAYKQAELFFNCGRKDEDSQKNVPKLMDWEQDESIMFAAVNKVAGMEVRACEYMHWWTFMSYYMGINESLFSEVINIREKKAKGKKLEKYEKEFYQKNKSLVDFKKVYSDEEIKENKELEELLGI